MLKTHHYIMRRFFVQDFGSKPHGNTRGIFVGCAMAMMGAVVMYGVAGDALVVYAAPLQVAKQSPKKAAVIVNKPKPKVSPAPTKKPAPQKKPPAKVSPAKPSAKKAPVKKSPTKKSVASPSPTKASPVKSSSKPPAAPMFPTKPTEVKSVPAKTPEKFTRDLSYGTKNNSEVVALQLFLRSIGFFSGPATGNYFSMTAAAVRAFQRAQLLPASGAWRSETRAKANAVARNGSSVFGSGIAASVPVKIVSPLPIAPVSAPVARAPDPVLPVPIETRVPSSLPPSFIGGGGGGGGVSGGGSTAGASPAAVIASPAISPVAPPTTPPAARPVLPAPVPVVIPAPPLVMVPPPLPPPPSLPAFKIFNTKVTPDITGAKIEWETTLPGDTKLFLSGDGHTRIFPSLAGFSTRHIVEIGDLTPETAYSFEIEAITDKTRTDKTMGTFSTLAAPPAREIVQRILPRVPDAQEPAHQQCFDALNPAGGTLVIAPVSFQSSVAAGAYIERIAFTLSGSAQFGADFSRVRVRDGAGSEHLAESQGRGFVAVLPPVKKGTTVEIMADTTLSSEGKTLMAIIEKPDDIVFRRSRYSRTTFSYGAGALTAFPITGLRHLMVRDVMAPAQDYFRQYCP